MAPKTITIRTAGESAKYKIDTGGSLTDAGMWGRTTLGSTAKRLLIVSDRNVFKYYGQTVEASFTEAGFQTFLSILSPGEKSKDLRSLNGVLNAASEAGIERTDAVIALGGGVVGDIAGFAAAVYLRGIRYLQMPTTLLAMVDSSVGGKTGVNTPFGKNLVGAFHQPSGALIDVTTLATLPRREITAGACEMIKHGALSGRELLDQTDKFLMDQPVHELAYSLERHGCRKALSKLIAANIEFKANIVGGDEHEKTSRLDPRSRKILNFGHTLAHALEKATNYREFRHGEAVGYGILFAAELSKSLALLDETSVNLLYDVVHRAGPLPSVAGIDRQAVIEAFEYDKKKLAGSLRFVLLKGFGKPTIVSANDIPRSSIHKALARTFVRV